MMPVLLRGWSTRASINRNSSGRAYSFWSITIFRKHLSSSLSHTLSNDFLSLHEESSQRLPLVGIHRELQSLECLPHAWFQVFLLFQWNFLGSDGRQEIWLWKSLSIVHSFVIWAVFRGLKMRTSHSATVSKMELQLRSRKKMHA
jgi:hypothetical protein